MRVELHCHSTASDGTEAPSEVAARATARGVALFALTDHDTCTEIAVPGARVHRAVELSCDEPGTGRTIHVLAYDRGAASWSELVARLGSLMEARRNRMRVMAARLAQRGIRIDIEPLLARSEGKSVGRPDLARLMVAAGAATSLKDAFARHLYDGGPVDVPHHALALPDALALGRAAGAALALAHPHLYDQLGVALLRRHREDGLDGVEAFYGAYDPRERTRWIELADELGLVCTGGSDWHGPSDGSSSSSQVGVDLPDERAARLCEWLAAA
jgi:predicted metal-dependent phosphoesterase TrpH